MAESFTTDMSHLKKQWAVMMEKEAPENILRATNEVAKEVGREMRRAAPKGPPVNLARRAKRLQFARRGDYGPLKRSLRRRGARVSRRAGKVRAARIWFQAFYIRFIILGSAHNRANPFIDRVLARGDEIMRKAIAKTKMVRKK